MSSPWPPDLDEVGGGGGGLNTLENHKLLYVP